MARFKSSESWREKKEMRIRFLFYRRERSVSSRCMKLGELLDLIARGYPGAQILEIEVMEASGNSGKEEEK